jgi:hypothetical protein
MKELPSLEEIEKILVREACLKSTALMSEIILGFKNPPHIKEWYDILDNKAYKKIVIAAPRSSAKSTCVSVNFPLNEIVRNCNIRILIVSNTLDQAQLFLREIKGRIERDPKYREYAGDLVPRYPEKWTDREIIINRTNLELKDATISTVGMGGSILTRRADLIICDDILNPENTRTPEQRTKVKTWFYEVLMPVLEPGGRLIFIGTIWHPNDLLSELLEDPSYDFRKKYKAIISDSKRKDLWDKWVELMAKDKREAKKFLEEHRKEMYEGVKVLWEERLPYELLYLLRKENYVAFQKMYQNEIVSGEESKFKEEWIEKAKEMGKNYRLVRHPPPDLNLKMITQGVDLAISQKSLADDTVVLTLGKLPDDRFIILNIERGKFTPAETRSIIREQFEAFKPIQIRVENVAYQEAMRRDLADMSLPVKGYKTGSEKFDEFVGIDSIAVLMENERLILPYDKTDPRTIFLIDQLCDEMRQFPSGHTGDSLMALWFAYTAMRDISKGQGFFEYMKETEKELKEKKGMNLQDWYELYRKQFGE